MILKVIAVMMMVAPTLVAQQTLATMVNKNRVLLVFAAGQFDGKYGQQLDMLAHHSAEFGSRDLVLVPIVPEGGTPNGSVTLRELQSPRVGLEEQTTLRRRFHVAVGEFAVVLLGKDGGEKLRSSVPVSMARLEKLIDAMPMRQEEMRKGR